MRLPEHEGRVDLREVLKDLGQRQILNLLIEGGAELNGAAIAGEIVDKMVLFYARKIMGSGGVPLAQLPSSDFPKSRSLSRLTLHGFGRDFAVEGYFHDVYGNNGTSREKLKRLSATARATKMAGVFESACRMPRISRAIWNSATAFL